MKKFFILISLLLTFGLAFYPAPGQSQGGYGSDDGPGYGYGYGMGPGMMGGYGHGMGPGLMGGHGHGPQGGYGPQGGGWYCPYCGSHMGGWYGPQSRYQQSQKPVDEKEAASIAKTYIQRNPNLKVGQVKDVGNAFEVEIRTKNNELVDKILVDKYSGWIRSAY